jgi:hypothetical protein
VKDQEIKFSAGELIREAWVALFSKGGLAGAFRILFSGEKYNVASKSDDRYRMAEAYKGLDPKLKSIKKAKFRNRKHISLY